jgi:hypothetical protein
VEEVVDTIPIISILKVKCSMLDHGKTATRIIQCHATVKLLIQLLS